MHVRRHRRGGGGPVALRGKPFVAKGHEALYSTDMGDIDAGRWENDAFPFLNAQDIDAAQ